MARLFLAIDLPPPVTAALAHLPTPPLAGIKLVEAAQMHLTLHFIGEAQLETVMAALRLVRARPFALTISGVGKFRTRNSGVILWAGVAPNDALAALHQAVSVALAAGVLAGAQPERHYQPHITLAKCKRDVPAECIASFINTHAALILSEVQVDRFALYSSTSDSEGVKYKIEASFPLL